MLDHQTGVFFQQADLPSLCGAFEEFEKQNFDRERIIRHARTFHTNVFLEKMRKAVQ